MPPLHLVLFDLDGTLIETAGEIADAVNDTLHGHELPAVSQAQVDAWIGHGTGALLLKVFAYAWQRAEYQVSEHPEWPRVLQTFNRCYLQRCGMRSTLYPYVREVLQTLVDHGVKLALVTNKEALFTHAILQAHQLEGYFAKVVCGDTLHERKPDPAGVRLCLAQLGVAAENALFVGDSAIDAQTAHNAGLRVWLLPYGYNRGEPLEVSKPDRIVADVREVLSLLGP